MRKVTGRAPDSIDATPNKSLGEKGKISPGETKGHTVWEAVSRQPRPAAIGPPPTFFIASQQSFRTLGNTCCVNMN